jgi:indolepyruvate ferredoxin oxidoreductase beta subunit
MKQDKSSNARPVCILISALGGEGGGVLKDWVVHTAHAAGYPVQATSIPGVAQRTGATTYYVEVFPVKRVDIKDRWPVLCLSPTAGQVDFFVGSELMEAARQMQAGMVSGRTTFIASTHRVYTTAEKMAMGDGRFDSDLGLDAARAVAQRAILFDMEAETRKAGTVISAVMFGALIGALQDALALPRELAEGAIKSGGKGTEPSLRGFAAGYAHAAPAENAPENGSQSASPAIAPAPEAQPDFVTLGRQRCLGYLDSAYAQWYGERLAPVLARNDERLTRETARYLALWMCYEDVARVADLKSRLERFDGIRAEAAATPDQPIKVVEFFKPGYGEVADQLPPALGEPLRAWAKKHGKVAIFENGIHVESTALTGYAKLRLLAFMGRFRRSSSRYLLEQSQIERWLAAIVKAPTNELALEIALTARLIKGYSDTHQRGKENFLRIMETLVEHGDYSTETRTAYIRAAREAALADPEGRKLDGSLETAGIAPRPIKTQTVKFYPRDTEKRN